ncbi:hypothetical protein D3C76_1171330 [compost metagenome]
MGLLVLSPCRRILAAKLFLDLAESSVDEALHGRVAQPGLCADAGQRSGILALAYWPLQVQCTLHGPHQPLGPQLLLPWASASEPARKSQVIFVIHQSQKHRLDFGERRLLEPKAGEIEKTLGQLWLLPHLVENILPPGLPGGRP